MGISDLLPHLPGGGKNNYHHSFLKLGFEGKVVPFDAAGALWQFASHHAWDYLRGNYTPALNEWGNLLVYLRSICKWKLVVYLDGSENIHKTPEIERRARRAENAREHNDLIGQIKNTPEYITKAHCLCTFLRINVSVSAFEADPQVVHASIPHSLIPVSGDSDLLAYRKSEEKVVTKVVIVKGYKNEWHRMITLGDDTPAGDYPLNDLYRKHGKITIQLYAACTGCDFTTHPSGINGIGYETFIKLVSTIAEGELSATSLAAVIWKEKQNIALKAGFMSSKAVEQHLQDIVNIYSSGKVYDNDANIIDMTTGDIITEATSESKLHMRGDVNSKTRREHPPEFVDELNNTDWSQFIHATAANTSTIRGVTLPAGKEIHQCNVTQLSDFVAARGGKISIKKPELITAASCYQFLEDEVPKKYVDRHPDPNGSLFAKIDTSGTRAIGDILRDLAFNNAMLGASNTYQLVLMTYQLYRDGMFEDKHDNIARTAPELPESFIYREFCGIGQSISQKNIGDALKRCFYETENTYHGIAFVPETNKVIMLSKAHASMARDEKTRNQTADGEAPKKKEYLVIMELFYEPTDEMDDKHDLGIFVRMGHHYCAQCVAGQAKCRHLPERLWYQFHQWTPERHGIERPSTIDVCGWAHGGRVLGCEVRQKIYNQQTVKYMGTIEEQNAKMKRGVKRDCTEGNSCDYKVHRSSAKQNPSSFQFAYERTRKLFKLLREQP